MRILVLDASLYERGDYNLDAYRAAELVLVHDSGTYSCVKHRHGRLDDVQFAVDPEEGQPFKLGPLALVGASG